MAELNFVDEAGDLVTIPYRPRAVQKRIHEELDQCRFGVVVAHRRMGKTVAMVNQLIRRAVTDGKERGFYGYVAPFLKQGKLIAWEYLKHFAGIIPGRKFNEQELFVALPNGARIRIFGADNPDALRGLYFDGVVLDEVAQMRPEVWGEIIQPALADREGWAVFIGTPKGVNLFHELHLRAQRDQSGHWRSLVYPVYETMRADDPPLAEAEVARLKNEMSDTAFRQEFMCDFAASSDDVLIKLDLAVEASDRVITRRDLVDLPLVVGVDVARYGSDSTVFFRRQGRAAFPPLVLNGLSNKAVSERLINFCGEHRPVAVFIDSGQGQGVIDWVCPLIPNVVEVPFGGRAINNGKFANRRAEMWFLLRQWLESGGALPNDSRLIRELTAPRYFFNDAGKIQLEPKDKIVERLGFSPDLADALALTLAQPVSSNLAARRPGRAVQTINF